MDVKKIINIAAASILSCCVCAAAVERKNVFTLKLPSHGDHLNLNRPEWQRVVDSVNALLENNDPIEKTLSRICGSNSSGLHTGKHSGIQIPIYVDRNSRTFVGVRQFPDQWIKTNRGWILFGNDTDVNADGVKTELERSIRYRLNLPVDFSRDTENWNLAVKRLQALAGRFWNYENTMRLDPMSDLSLRQFSLCHVFEERTLLEEASQSVEEVMGQHRVIAAQEDPAFIPDAVKIRFDRMFCQQGGKKPVQEWHDFLTQGFPEDNAYHDVATDLGTVRFGNHWDYWYFRYLIRDEHGGYRCPFFGYDDVIHHGNNNTIIVTFVIGIQTDDILFEEREAFNVAMATLKDDDLGIEEKIEIMGNLLQMAPDKWHVASFYIK
jgi:hypothetical protein